MTQCDMIISYMKEFGSITTMQAFSDLGITRLASRIHDLQKSGYDIDREIIRGKNRYDEPVHYMRYTLRA